jgi:group II intron reverse transcriptase/maturase
MLKEQVKEQNLIHLIRRFLRSGVMIDGLCSPTEKGAPQGGPLSPLLSNIYLTKFDNLLEERGLKFVRYADDCNIYVKSRRAAERVMKTSTEFLEEKLKLKVNQEKSQVGSPVKLKFLGFAMWKLNGKSGIRIHEASEKRLKDKIRAITRRNRGVSPGFVCYELKMYLRGWIGYYRLASLKSKAKVWDGWLRRKIRAFIWKKWKLPKARYRNLKNLGIDKKQGLDVG